MKIRTITCFVHLEKEEATWEATLRQAHHFGVCCKAMLEASSWEVQTIRVSTQPTRGWAEGDLLQQCTKAAALAKSIGIEFFSMGCIDTKGDILLLPDILSSCENGYLSILLHDDEDREIVEAAADTILNIAERNVEMNFRSCVSAHMNANTPFFPASFASPTLGPHSIGFAIGTECSGDLVDAIPSQKSEKNIKEAIRDRFEALLVPIAGLCRSFTACTNVEWMDTCFSVSFMGIDISIAPSTKKEESVVVALEKAGYPPFGECGSIAGMRLLTSSLKMIRNVTTCGYKGVMLPICEDAGLAALSTLRVYDILLASCVCGCGLDCVPLVGTTSRKEIAGLLLDLQALAYGIGKPLSARLLPVPSLKRGEDTDFKNPYLVDARVFVL